MSILEFLERALAPKYIGWEDQYKAILTAMGIDPDAQYSEVLFVLSALKGEA